MSTFNIEEMLQPAIIRVRARSSHRLITCTYYIMPNPYSFGEMQSPSQAIEHIASRPALKKQMSRVWSRCLSINRKNQPRPGIRRVREDEFESVLKSGSERRVFVERGYEVVPRITSTHLAKTRGGFREVQQVCYVSPSHLKLMNRILTENADLCLASQKQPNCRITPTPSPNQLNAEPTSPDDLV